MTGEFEGLDGLRREFDREFHLVGRQDGLSPLTVAVASGRDVPKFRGRLLWSRMTSW